jgi:hypothetical protein
LWAKELNAKDIHKEMFPVYGGEMSTFRKHFADDEEVDTEVRKWLKQQSKDFFYAAGFDALVKRWDKCINVAVPVSNITCFTFYIH